QAPRPAGARYRRPACSAPCRLRVMRACGLGAVLGRTTTKDGPVLLRAVSAATVLAKPSAAVDAALPPRSFGTSSRRERAAYSKAVYLDRPAITWRQTAAGFRLRCGGIGQARRQNR